jgi:integrase
MPQFGAIVILAVTVSGNLVVGYSGGVERDDPKTASARRTVRLPEVAAAALRRTTRTGILVFPSARGGGPMLASTLLRQHFRPLLAKAGLPSMPFHDLRHTAATHMLEDGIPPHVVARVPGHANVGVTMGIDAHVTAAMTDAAAMAMDLRYSSRATKRGYNGGLTTESLTGPRSSVDRAEVS